MLSIKSEASQNQAVVKVSHFFEAVAECVFDAWLDPEKVRKFLFKTPTGIMQCVDIDPHIGGTYYIIERRDGVNAEHRGTYLDIIRPTRLVFMLEDTVGFQNTLIRIDITPIGKCCELILNHEVVLPEYEEKVHDGWTKILEELAKIISARAKDTAI